jgi:DNA topoisomerase VI subunit B
MAATLERMTFETSRAAEYFDARELQAQTGQPIELFAAVVMKEGGDNGLDAAETAGVAPEISFEIARNETHFTLTLHDNGGGISPETVRRILNFETRTSDKSAYRAPTRGLQGNAFKTILGIPCALGTDAPVIIEACNTRHIVRAWIDPAGELRIEHDTEHCPSTEGTRLSLTLPSEGQDFSADHWARAFALFNPHAVVKIHESHTGEGGSNLLLTTRSPKIRILTNQPRASLEPGASFSRPT